MQLYFNKDTELKGNFTEELQPQFVGQTADSAPAQSGKRKKPDDEIAQVISSNEMQSRMIDDRLNSMNQLQMLQAEIFKMKDEKSDLGQQRHSAMLELVAAERNGDKDYIIELLRTTYDTATADIGKLEDSIQAKQKELQQMESDAADASKQYRVTSVVSSAPPKRVRGRRSSTPSSVSSSTVA
jgi:hypothetical protein